MVDKAAIQHVLRIHKIAHILEVYALFIFQGSHRPYVNVRFIRMTAQ